MDRINITQLNKFRTQIEKNKKFIDSLLEERESEEKKYSMAVSMSVLIEYLQVNQKTAFDSLTDGSNDNKIDAFYYSDDEEEIGELIVIQSKYKKEDGSTGSFHEDDIKLCINSCKKILSGDKFQEVNEKLEEKIKDYKKLLEDNDFPPITIKLFFATNGIIDDEHKKLEEVINCTGKNIDIIFADATFFENKPSFEKAELKVNVKNDQDKTDSIFSIDDTSYSGMITSCNLKDLMSFYKENGERFLLNNNVRFLIKNSSINKKIVESFISDPKKFCYLNNGISIVCTEYSIKETFHSFNKIEILNPSIVNGGQTIASIYQLYINKYSDYENQFKEANIIVKIYQAPKEYNLKIAEATNSQNPIRITDLHSNDNAQSIAKDYLAKLGIGLICKNGEDTIYYDDTITNENILQIYASLFEDDPAKAKLSKSYIFVKYYDSVFNNNINDDVCGKLYRCYQISKFINSGIDSDPSLIKNGFYSIIYTMKKLEENILNIKIPDNEIIPHFQKAFDSSINIIKAIVERKKEELQTKFSLNNLFKNNEIKNLIDIEIEK